MLCWDNFTADARDVMMLAHGEADRLGHPYQGGEHLLLGLLAHGDNTAAGLLADRGLDLDTARSDLRRIVAESARPDGAAALRGWGIDVDEVRRQLESSFGAVAVREAAYQVARRPWWRGGGRTVPSWRKPVLHKRALDMAARHARRQGASLAAPEHLLFGVLRDARDPLGTGLSRRSRNRVFAQTGLREGAPHPVRLLLDVHGIDLQELIAASQASR